MSLIETLLGEFREKKDLACLLQREIRFPVISGKVKVVLGIRRAGKTQLLYQKIKQLRENGVPLSQILYLNFEDERLLPLDAKKLGVLVDEFYGLYPENHEKLSYFFFDEIQNVENWPLLVRRLLDTGKADLTLTGSSSKLLSKEIATSLRGRAYPIEVWPFSFREYLLLLNQKEPVKPMGPAQNHRLMRQVKQFLVSGGFAEVALLDSQDRNLILQDYINTLLFRDIIERHKLTNLSLIKKLIKTLVSQCASKITVNKIFRDFKSQGFAVSKNTLHDYLSYIEDAYFAFTVPLYTHSFRKQNVNPRKIYLADTGLFTANTLSTGNWGRLFENLVYLDLRRRRCEIFYYVTKSDYEVDFVVKFPDGKHQLIQVCWDISDRTVLERENRAISEAKRELKIKETLLLHPKNYFLWILNAD